MARSTPVPGLKRCSQGTAIDSGSRCVGAEDGTGRPADSFAGSEVDLTLIYKATKNFTLQAGYSHFFAGDYLNDAGSGVSDDADFFYIQGQFDL